MVGPFGWTGWTGWAGRRAGGRAQQLQRGGHLRVDQVGHAPALARAVPDAGVLHHRQHVEGGHGAAVDAEVTRRHALLDQVAVDLHQGPLALPQ
jgi:hypothetical protein